MGWILFVISAWLVALLTVPLKGWKKSWPMGIIAMAIVYLLDNTLAQLGAFRFWHGGIYISGLPLYYWISYFAGGIVFDYFRPHKHSWRLAYILICAAVYLGVELIMIYFGYFQHFNWNAFKAYQLNVIGFTIAMWFAEWLNRGN